MAGKQSTAVGAAANCLLGILVGLMSVSVLILFGVLSDSPRRWQCPAFVFRFSFVFSKELQLCNKMIQLHGGKGWPGSAVVFQGSMCDRLYTQKLSQDKKT